eukprot:1399670-Pyramimonas_sp.AAC.1
MSDGGILEDRPRSLSNEGGWPVPEAAHWGGSGDDGWVDRAQSAHFPDPHPIGSRPRRKPSLGSVKTERSSLQLRRGSIP